MPAKEIMDCGKKEGLVLHKSKEEEHARSVILRRGLGGASPIWAADGGHGPGSLRDPQKGTRPCQKDARTS